MGNLLLQFLAGLFAVNSVPHLVQGLCGRRFRTPFVRFTDGKTSGPIVNVIWGWVNLGLAWWLWTVSAPATPLYMVIGVVLGGIGTAAIFSRDHG